MTRLRQQAPFVSSKIDRLRTENAKLKSEVEALQEHENQTHNILGAILGTNDSLENLARSLVHDLAHHKQLLVERDRVLGVAREALKFIYDDADFESLEEEARVYQVLRKALDQINKVLEVPKP